MPLLCSNVPYGSPFHSECKPVSFQWPRTQWPALLPSSLIPLYPLLPWLSCHSITLYSSHTGSLCSSNIQACSFMFPYTLYFLLFPLSRTLPHVSSCLTSSKPSSYPCPQVTLSQSEDFPQLPRLKEKFLFLPSYLCFSPQYLSLFDMRHLLSVYLQQSLHTRMWVGISVCLTL